MLLKPKVENGTVTTTATMPGRISPPRLALPTPQLGNLAQIGQLSEVGLVQSIIGHNLRFLPNSKGCLPWLPSRDNLAS